jgi:hypothetical protein
MNTRDHRMRTPVAFLIFNRPETTARVFDAIRQARPPKLLVVADGPRLDRVGEALQCKKAREVVSRVDWPCEILTNYATSNLGCKHRVSSGLDWVFSLVDEAVILEDDCLPHPDFFAFSEAMLERYRDDSRIAMICGTNYLLEAPGLPESYFFSNYYPIWGWATWRRAWKHYDVNIAHWNTLKHGDHLAWGFGHRRIAQYYADMFDLAQQGFDTWDIQWWFACVFNHGLAIVPRTNLISNLGLEGSHTQTQGDLFTNMPTKSLDPDHLIHPQYVYPDAVLNRLLFELSHANLDLSFETALRNKGWKGVVRMLLPDRIRRTIAQIKQRISV